MKIHKDVPAPERRPKFEFIHKMGESDSVLMTKKEFSSFRSHCYRNNIKITSRGEDGLIRVWRVQG